ncbi:MAG TPA: hypothetical protein VHU87_11685 [Rhizomicrobium sp.]|jgi:hypothetical protein|nr:hypothetical protein [Rhizomicrobium sp.]
MDPLYLIGSVAGIAVLVGLNVLLFGRCTGALDLAALGRALALDQPGFRAGDGVVAGDAALVENAADGALYLVRAGGDKFVTRKLSRGSVRGLSRDGSRLDLRFADFTFPRARLAFADEASAADWQARLSRAAG